MASKECPVSPRGGRLKKPFLDTTNYMMKNQVFVHTFEEPAKATEKGTPKIAHEVWTHNHAKLLYLVSKYGRVGYGLNPQSWMRHAALNVLVYEGIVQKELDLDYAPCSTLISAKGKCQRIWLNISQEAKSAIEDLRSKDLLQFLKISSEHFQPITAYQASFKGLDFIDKLPMALKQSVDAFTTDKQGYQRIVRFMREPKAEEEEEEAEVEPGPRKSAGDNMNGYSSVEVGGSGPGAKVAPLKYNVTDDNAKDRSSFSSRQDESLEERVDRLMKQLGATDRGENTHASEPAGPAAAAKESELEDNDEEPKMEGLFYVSSGPEDQGYRSGITETEDVSYVSSPYLPQCVRNPRSVRPFTNNKSRAHESANAGSTLRDELESTIKLSQVRCLVSEWVPFGSNNIVALNERLGALDRCQGGLFTAMVDKSPTSTKFESNPGLTQVTILDFDYVHFINFEAEINFPEEDGIVQVENFGMHLNIDGTVLYGIKVEAIMEHTAEHITLDHLSRLLVDIHQDSSHIMDDILSNYQRNLLDMMFMGDADMRGKYNMILCYEVKPFLHSADYLDRDCHENELKQVLGDLHNAHDIGDHGLVVIGRNGILCAGKQLQLYEPILVLYASLTAREMFVRTYFVRAFILDDHLKQVRHLIIANSNDPTTTNEIRRRMNRASRNLVLLTEVLGYLDEAMIETAQKAAITNAQPKTGKHTSECYMKLTEALDTDKLCEDVTCRVNDVKKLVHAMELELHTLGQMTDIINTKKLEDVFKSVEGNTRYLVDAFASTQRAAVSLQVMQIILAGSFAFDIIDRISGGSLNIQVPDWVNIYLVDVIIDVPFVWFILNISWLIFMSYSLLRLMDSMGDKANGAMTFSKRMDMRISVHHLQKYFETEDKEILAVDTLIEQGLYIRKISWVESDDEKWKGEPPEIEAQYDHCYGFLLAVLFKVNTRNTTLGDTGLMEVFMKELEAAKVIVPYEGVEKLLLDLKREEEERAKLAKKKEWAE